MDSGEPRFADENDLLAWFFEMPATNPAEHSRDGAVSVLYLLRRELIETLGHDPNTTTEQLVDRLGSRNRLFASTILMFTAVDLLAKFMFGDLGGLGDRFKRFLQSPDGGELSPQDAALLWALRNSLVHAFGLPDSERLTETGHLRVGIGQRLATSDPDGLVTISHRGDDAIVFVDGLFRIVRNGVAKYQATLYGADSSEGRVAFRSTFSDYGWIKMGNEA